MCPNATLSTTNPIWTAPESNPFLHDNRPAASRLSHGMASDIHNYLYYMDEIQLAAYI